MSSFDRLNHDVLMARVARKVKDERVLMTGFERDVKHAFGSPKLGSALPDLLLFERIARGKKRRIMLAKSGRVR